MDSAIDDVTTLGLKITNLLSHIVELTDSTVRGAEDGALEGNLLEISELLVGAFEETQLALLRGPRRRVDSWFEKRELALLRISRGRVKKSVFIFDMRKSSASTLQFK